MQDNITLKHVSVINMHGHQSFTLDFAPGLNVVYGKNGTGKTTILHAIVNLLDSDIERFLHIRFDEITITTYDDQTFRLSQKNIDGSETVVYFHYNNDLVGTCTKESSAPSEITELLRKCFPKRPVFLPAFRSILEGTPHQARRTYSRTDSEYSDKERLRIVERETEFFQNKLLMQFVAPYVYHEQAQLIAQKTLMCRSWFGDFVPTVRYPSIAEVYNELEGEIERARYMVAAEDEKNFSTVFRQVLEVALSKNLPPVNEDTDSLVSRVKTAVQDLEPDREDVPAVYGEIAEFLKTNQYADIASSDKIRGILKVYDDALIRRDVNKNKAYAGINTFIESVNRFLESKQLGYEYKRLTRRTRGKSYITLPDKRKVGFHVLSSGERHVLTLLFSATHMSPTDGIVLIDEPELSLHVDWQRIILGEIMKQAKDRQIIACTHAPEVAAEHIEAYVELINAPPISTSLSEDAQEELDLEG